MALNPDNVRANFAAVREEVAEAAKRAGRSPGDVEIVAAVKYVALEDMPALVEAGVTTVGENRAQELQRKAEAFPDLTWDFIGQLQSRKVKTIAPLVRCIHSVGSGSAARQLEKVLVDKPVADWPRLLLQVNIAGEEGKAGIPAGAVESFLDDVLDDWPIGFEGLMVMPPLADDPEDSRRWFAAARDLAERLDLDHLSMGTTQDFAVAVEEGATMVRVGTVLYRADR